MFLHKSITLQGMSHAARRGSSSHSRNCATRTRWLTNVAPGGHPISSIDVDIFREALCAVTEKCREAKSMSASYAERCLERSATATFSVTTRTSTLGSTVRSRPRCSRSFSGDARFQRLSRLSDEEIVPCYRFKGRVAVDFFRLFSEGDSLWYGLTGMGKLSGFATAASYSVTSPFSAFRHGSRTMPDATLQNATEKDGERRTLILQPGHHPILTAASRPYVVVSPMQMSLRRPGGGILRARAISAIKHWRSIPAIG